MSVITVAQAIDETGMTPFELWAKYIAIGGNMHRDSFAAEIRSGDLAVSERYALVQALNDWYTERGRNHPVPY